MDNSSQPEHTEVIVTQRDVDNILLFIGYLIFVLILLRYFGLVSLILLNVVTIWYLNRVRMFDRVGLLQPVLLGVVIQSVFPFLIGLTSVDYLMIVIKTLASHDVKENDRYITLAILYMLITVIVTIFNHMFLKKQAKYKENLGPALEMGKLVIWESGLLFSISVLIDGIEDVHIKVSYLLILAPIILCNHGFKYGLEMEKVRKPKGENR
ncbi:hypothetical protein PAECIP111892_04671 [Paenibacillus auburnensis]|uniref:Uncharacterized protein n=1 Tax=Paenibacillus auburnensis TaxID=2905649 RepID=A0ABM9CN31_9BACL|nr:hypothetical protein [Paenibacillus auburnensis]CAH1219139.1 hypothetical protein PAECIP111892_04671 [Paenibacillus auburnensis]